MKGVVVATPQGRGVVLANAVVDATGNSDVAVAAGADFMPQFLQDFAMVLPLYYINEGLRNAMIYLKMDDALYYTVITLIFASIFFIAGVFLTKWDED